MIQIDDDATDIRLVWFRPERGRPLEEWTPICELDYDIRARRSRISHPQRVDDLDSYHWHGFGPEAGMIRARYHAMPFPCWAVEGGPGLSLSPCVVVGWNGLAEFYVQDEASTRTLGWNGRLGGEREGPSHPDMALVDFRIQRESRYALLVPKGGRSIYLFDLVPERAKGLARGPVPSDVTGTHKTFLSIHK